jgi:hypothetical protein
VTITLQVKLILWVHENKANNTVDLWLLRQQILAMTEAMMMLFFQLLLQTQSWMNSRVSIHLTCLGTPLVLFTNFIVFSVECHGVRTTPWIRGQASLGAFKKPKKREIWKAEYISTAKSNKLQA